METDNHFDIEVKNLRQSLGLTQEQFANKIGVTFPTVNRWENKKTKPSPLAIEKLKRVHSQLEKKELLKVAAASLPQNEKIQ